MNKIPTLFIRDPQNMKLVTQGINPEALWVFTSECIPTRKRDGTNIRITMLNGISTRVEKRRNPTREEKALGAEPGYVIATRDDPDSKHIFAAIDMTNFTDWPNGEWPCEALGPKIQGGVESNVPLLYPFSFRPIRLLDFPTQLTFASIRDYLATHEIEGIVWHDRMLHRMAKIKRRDFNLPWPIRSK